MSDFDTAVLRAPDDETAKKPRARIPRSDWGYVLGQSRIAGRTLQSIGDEYGAEPSAIHYVVKKASELAEKGDLQPTLEKPQYSEQEAAAAAERAISKARRSNDWAARRIQETTAPAQPSQVELMAKQANAMLEDEHCKRLFDATSKTIVDYVAFKAGPEASAKQQFKDALHELRRAIASIELKIELAPSANTATPAPLMARRAEPA